MLVSNSGEAIGGSDDEFGDDEDMEEIEEKDDRRFMRASIGVDDVIGEGDLDGWGMILILLFSFFGSR
jgi:hypothetical protein